MGPLTTEAVPLHVGANGAPRSKFAYPKLYNSHCALGLGVGLECELWNMGATCKDAAGGGIRCNSTYSIHTCKFLLLFMTPLNQADHKLDKNCNGQQMVPKWYVFVPNLRHNSNSNLIYDLSESDRHDTQV